ncbi:MAG: GNAT family N-acetyltransferase [Caldilineaceae bacterium]
MTITIQRERPDTPDAMTLIAELDDILAPLYAVESRHGFSVQKLIDQGVEFFVVRVDDRPAGCGGVQFFLDEPTGHYGELKRMYVRPGFRGLGLAKRLLYHFEEVAAQKAVATLRLETGIYQTEAIQLYERNGYYRIAPFGNYRVDPVSLCYEKRVDTH